MIVKRNKIAKMIENYWKDIHFLLDKHVPDHIFKTFDKLLDCRTEKLGCHIYQCPQCNEVVIVRHSCKSRFCSSCGTAYTDT